MYGLSTQDTEYQSEAAQRLHLPFPLLSDARLDFARREFNAAVDRYNTAVEQFPTLLLARLFGFRIGATL